MHQARGAGKRKSPKRFSLLTFVLIGDTGTRRMVLRLACAHLNHAACNLHGLVAKPRLRQAQPSRIAKQHRFTEGLACRDRNRDGFASASGMVKRGRIVRSTFFPGLFCTARRAFPCVPW